MMILQIYLLSILILDTSNNIYLFNQQFFKTNLCDIVNSFDKLN